ncbi:hypothetical protein scyTo_0018725, partial [Scyliorhinus torazame]|nr:hypothetical protein [Scyliorhinus torazame]
IYEYAFPDVNIAYGNFENRIQWFGSKKTEDIQEATIILHNVSFSDAGTYRCFFNRTFYYRGGKFILFTQVNKTIELTVAAKENRKLASIIGEIMMKLFKKMHRTTWRSLQKARRTVQGYKWRISISQATSQLLILFKHICWE